MLIFISVISYFTAIHGWKQEHCWTLTKAWTWKPIRILNENLCARLGCHGRNSINISKIYVFTPIFLILSSISAYLQLIAPIFIFITFYISVKHSNLNVVIWFLRNFYILLILPPYHYITITIITLQNKYYHKFLEIYISIESLNLCLTTNSKLYSK